MDGGRGTLPVRCLCTSKMALHRCVRWWRASFLPRVRTGRPASGEGGWAMLKSGGEFWNGPGACPLTRDNRRIRGEWGIAARRGGSDRARQMGGPSAITHGPPPEEQLLPPPALTPPPPNGAPRRSRGAVSRSDTTAHLFIHAHTSPFWVGGGMTAGEERGVVSEKKKKMPSSNSGLSEHKLTNLSQL